MLFMCRIKGIINCVIVYHYRQYVTLYLPQTLCIKTPHNPDTLTFVLQPLYALVRTWNTKPILFCLHGMRHSGRFQIGQN